MNQLRQLAQTKGSLLRTSELNAAGLTPYHIRKLVSQGQLQRVREGYFQLPPKAGEPEAAIIERLFPDGILCLYTALHYYRYSDRVSDAWDIAVSKDTSKARFKLGYPYVHPYYLEPRHLEYGVQHVDYDGVALQMFDKDRLLCECMWYDSKMDRETFRKAILAYANDPEKDIAKLMDYARRRNVAKKTETIIGVLL